MCVNSAGFLDKTFVHKFSFRMCEKMTPQISFNLLPLKMNISRTIQDIN